MIECHGGFGAAFRTIISAEFRKQMEEAVSRKSGVAPADREGCEQRPARGMIFANQVLQSQRGFVNAVRWRHLGACDQITITHGTSASRAGHQNLADISVNFFFHNFTARASVVEWLMLWSLSTWSGL